VANGQLRPPWPQNWAQRLSQWMTYGRGIDDEVLVLDLGTDGEQEARRCLHVIDGRPVRYGVSVGF
jgi:hypothetical protein